MSKDKSKKDKKKHKPNFFDKTKDKFVDLVTKGHQTNDSEFDELFRRFTETKKNIDIVTSDVTRFLGSLDQLLHANEELSNHMRELFPSLSDTARLSEAQNATVLAMRNTKDTVLDPLIQEHFMEPIKVFLVQFRELSDRVKERQRRCSNMDKLITKVEKFKHDESPKLPGTEVKLGYAREAYEDLNAELKNDIPALLDNSAVFFMPILQNLIYTQSVFWSSLGQHANTLALNQGCSQPLPCDAPEVITPKSATAAHKSYAQEHNPWGTDPYGGHNDPYAQPNDPYAQPNDPYSQPIQQNDPYGQQQQQHRAPPPVQRSAPPPPSRPSSFPQAQGMWTFTGETSGELSFNAGDTIEVIEQNGDWWKGQLNGRVGLFPANYVKLL